LAALLAQQPPGRDWSEARSKHALSDELFDRAKKLLGEQEVVDLTGVAGTYVGVATLLAMAEQGAPADKEPPFKDGEPDRRRMALWAPQGLGRAVKRTLGPLVVEKAFQIWTAFDDRARPLLQLAVDPLKERRSDLNMLALLERDFV
jgi:hypothetical protein